MDGLSKLQDENNKTDNKKMNDVALYIFEFLIIDFNVIKTYNLNFTIPDLESAQVLSFQVLPIL